MTSKRQASLPKHASPLISSEEEEEENNDNDISTPTSSQRSKIPSSKKPTFDPNQTQNLDSSSEDEEDDSEDEKSKFTTTQSKQPEPRKDKEEEDSDSESGSDSDSPPAKRKSVRPSRSADPSIKPISSKPMDAFPKTKKPAAKADVAAPSPAKSTAQKRRATAAKWNAKDSKKRQKPSSANTADEDDEASAKKRLWSPEDELSILKGMGEFTKEGSNVYSDMNGFYEFIKKSIHVDVSRNQLTDKIRRLKQKYMAIAVKANRGKEPDFSKNHDKLVYDLANEIWGRKASITEDHVAKVVENENGVDKLNVDKKGASNAKSSRKNEEEIAVASPPPKSLEISENRTVISEGVGDRAVLYPHLKDSFHLSGTVSISGLSGLEESDVKRAFELMSNSQAKEWNERLMRLRVKERDVHMEKVTCVYELAKQCYDLINSSMDL